MIEDYALKRSLSLTLVTFYGIGTILGAGIYVLVGKVAGMAGMQTPAAFLLAALVAAFSAFSYAELASRFPRSAGEAVYIQQGFGIHKLSLLVGLMIVTVGIISTATLVHGFVGYLKVFVEMPDFFVIVLLVLVMGSIVAWGITQSVLLASLMTVVEIGGLVLIMWVGRESFTLLPQHLPEMLPSLDGAVWYGILLGSFIAFYAYIGYEDIVNVAEEVVQPNKNLPRAIITAMVVTTVFYILISVISILSLPVGDLAQSDAPLALLYQHATGQEPIVITLISLVSVINGAMIQIIMASRVLYGISRQGWLPSVIGYVHPVTRTPLLATLIVALLILLFALWLPLLSLAILTSFVTLSIFTLVNLALWRIKIRSEPAPESFSVPLWVPIVGFFLSLAFVLFQVFATLRG